MTKQSCNLCRYWSEMLAHSGPDTGGDIAAMCLSNDSQSRLKYTVGSQSCGDFKSGEFGAIDQPWSPDIADLYAKLDAGELKGSGIKNCERS